MDHHRKTIPIPIATPIGMKQHTLLVVGIGIGIGIEIHGGGSSDGLSLSDKVSNSLLNRLQFLSQLFAVFLQAFAPFIPGAILAPTMAVAPATTTGILLGILTSAHPCHLRSQ